MALHDYNTAMYHCRIPENGQEAIWKLQTHWSDSIDLHNSKGTSQ